MRSITVHPASLVLGFVVGGIALLSMSHALPLQEQRATSFTVVDSAGRERGFFGLRGDGQAPRLVLTDTDGVQRMVLALSLENGSPSVTLSNDEDKTGIMMAYDSPVRMADGTHRPGDANVTIYKDGQGLLTLSTGKSGDKGVGVIELLDTSNRQLFVQPAR